MIGGQLKVLYGVLFPLIPYLPLYMDTLGKTKKSYLELFYPFKSGHINWLDIFCVAGYIKKGLQTCKDEEDSFGDHSSNDDFTSQASTIYRKHF